MGYFSAVPLPKISIPRSLTAIFFSVGLHGVLALVVVFASSGTKPEAEALSLTPLIELPDAVQARLPALDQAPLQPTAHLVAAAMPERDLVPLPSAPMPATEVLPVIPLDLASPVAPAYIPEREATVLVSATPAVSQPIRQSFVASLPAPPPTDARLHVLPPPPANNGRLHTLQPPPPTPRPAFSAVPATAPTSQQTVPQQFTISPKASPQVGREQVFSAAVTKADVASPVSQSQFRISPAVPAAAPEPEVPPERPLTVTLSSTPEPTPLTSEPPPPAQTFVIETLPAED